MNRSGVICAGNFIVDRLRFVESWPEQEMLSSIASEAFSNGGGPYNVLKDLSAMGATFPLEAAGCVGDDPDGLWIAEDCRTAGIDTAQLHVVGDAPTSYTEVICVTTTAKRTFFHRRGANALLSQSHIDFSRSGASHFHLAYLMLLDALDEEGPAGRTGASELLEKAKNSGLTTSADLVSTENPRFQEKVAQSLPYIDYLFINELEAERATGLKIRQAHEVSISAALDAARKLLAGGVKRQVILHFSAGAVVCDVSGETLTRGSLLLSADCIVGTNGAGDAFAAGYLFGLQSGWSTSDCLNLAIATAAMCLRDASPSSGLLPVEQCLDLIRRFPSRDL